MIQWNQWRKAAGITGTLLGVLTVSGGPMQAVWAQSVYAVTSSAPQTGNPNNFQSFGYLNLNNGTFQSLQTFDRQDPNTLGGASLTGLAYSYANGNVFAIDSDSGLYQIGTSDQSFTLSSQIQYGTIDNGSLNGGVREQVRSIAFDRNTPGFLYGLVSDRNTGANAKLFRLSVNNGSDVTLVANLGFASTGGLAIITDANGNSTGFATQGTAATNGNGSVFQINLATGATSVLGGQAVAGFANPVSALAGVNGALKAADFSPTNSSATGNNYNVGLTGATTGVASVQSFYNMAANGGFLAITDGATPEPGTLGLLATGLTMGVGGVVVQRRRKTDTKAA